MTRSERIKMHDRHAAKAQSLSMRLRAKACPDCKDLLLWPDSVLIEENGQMMHYHRGVGKGRAGTMTPCLAYAVK